MMLALTVTISYGGQVSNIATLGRYAKQFISPIIPLLLENKVTLAANWELPI
jgi:hypothetical protein